MRCSSKTTTVHSTDLIRDISLNLHSDTHNFSLSHGYGINLTQALLYKKYSTASDVYSYGMVLYELWSLGLRPLSDIPFHKVCNMCGRHVSLCVHI